MKKIFALTFAATMACATSAFADCAEGEHGAISIQDIDGVCTAVIYGDATASEAYKTLDKFSATVDSVFYYKGTTTTKAAQSIVLPFSVKSGCKKEGLTFYSVKKIYKNASSKWTVLAQDSIDVAKDGLSANRPYLIEVESGKMFFKLGGEGCSFEINTSASVEDLTYDGESGLTGSWLLKGTYDGVQWAAGDSELGYVYGLSSKRIKAADGSDSVKVGQFVKAAAGASITPLRAYLRYVPKKAVGAKMRSLASAVEVPVDGEQDDVIDVVLGRSADAPAVAFKEGEDCFEEGDDIIEFKMVNGKRTACIDGQSDARLQTLNITETYEVDDIVYNRSFEPGVLSTVMFPFELILNTSINSTGVASFVDIKQQWNGSWEATFAWNKTVGTLEANTPYVLSPYELNTMNGDKTLILCHTPKNQSRACATVVPTDGKQHSVISESGNWALVGTYERIVWTKDSTAAIGKVYGFAANAKNGVKQGEFVKAKPSETSNPSVPPMRAYLRYIGDGSSFLAKSAAGTSIEEELPETITVKFIDGDGSTTAIGTMNTLTGEIKMDDNAWFDMKGRKMNHKPSVKGTYYNKGQKVIIK